MGVRQETIYIKIDQNTLCKDRNVTLQDVAKMECTNEAALRQIKQKKLYTFSRQENGKNKSNQAEANSQEMKAEKILMRGQAAKKQMQVFSFLKVVELIHEDYPDILVVNEGEKDFMLEYQPGPQTAKWLDFLKTAALCIVVFFGAAFTIMAFNNDISITDVFSKLYLQITGVESNNMTELEFGYCIGLALGIIIFFNHIGKKKITHDPTPIQIELRKFEKDVDTTFIENAGRAGHSIDVK